MKTIFIILGIIYLFFATWLAIKDAKEKKKGVKQRYYEHP